MSQDPYGGDVRNPASLHRYRYGSGNPVNRIDPSGRNDTTELAIGLGWTSVQAAVGVYTLGKSINCLYESEASAVQVLNGPLPDSSLDWSAHGVPPKRRTLTQIRGGAETGRRLEQAIASIPETSFFRLCKGLARISHAGIADSGDDR